jgi:hypothetical protein
VVGSSGPITVLEDEEMAVLHGLLQRVLGPDDPTTC